MKCKNATTAFFLTDDWPSYRRVLPQTRHSVSKGGTLQIERHKPNFRPRLKRLQRRTICFSRSEELQEISFPTMLDFPAPSLRAYRPETVIAEKFHEMVDLGLRNTRMKDFYDVWKLSQQFEFDGQIIVEAIRATFASRQTTLPSVVPLPLSDKFASDPLKTSQWTAFLRKSALKDQETSLAEVVSLIERFLLPAVERAQAGDRFPRRWTFGGSWEDVTISHSENEPRD